MCFLTSILIDTQLKLSNIIFACNSDTHGTLKESMPTVTSENPNIHVGGKKQATGPQNTFTPQVIHTYS